MPAFYKTCSTHRANAVDDVAHIFIEESAEQEANLVLKQEEGWKGRKKVKKESDKELTNENGGIRNPLYSGMRHVRAAS